jgi:MFS family permease
MVLCDGARGPLMLVIPVLHWAGALSFAALLAVAFALGAFGAPYFAAQKVIVPELLGEDETVVSRANALFQGATRVTMLLGPVTAGVLISVLSAPAVLVVDAATYMVAVALVVLFVPRRHTAPSEEQGGILRGLRFIVREPLLRIWWPIFAIGDAAWAGFFVSIPFLVVSRFDSDPRVAGWLLASFGVGAVLGNVVAYRFLLERVSGLTLIPACIMGQALPLWILTGHPTAVLASAALALSGIANGLVNPSIHTLTTLRVPAALRPSVMTTVVLLYALVQPLGVLGAGPILDSFGAQPVLVAFAATQTVTMAIVAIVSLRVRGARSAVAAEAA